jgi:amino acid transporter
MSSSYSQPQPTQAYGPGPNAYQQPAPRKGSGLAITSLVLGLIGLMLSWIPIINYLAVILGLVGLVLGVIGIWKSKRVMSIIGAVLCALTIIISFVAFASFADSVDKSISELEQELENGQPVD